MSEDKEIAAMAAIAKALEAIPAEEADARTRVLQWACARYKVAAPAITKQVRTDQNKDEIPETNGAAGKEFESLADLYHAAAPTTDVDRALVGGYWLGQGNARNEFTAADLNKELKQLGHPLSHVTDALQGLIDKRPALVMQTAKSGASRQARKKYKLTHAGVAAVAEMQRAAASG